MEQSSIVTTHLSTCMEWHNDKRIHTTSTDAAGSYIGTHTWKWVYWTVI